MPLKCDLHAFRSEQKQMKAFLMFSVQANIFEVAPALRYLKTIPTEGVICNKYIDVSD